MGHRLLIVTKCFILTFPVHRPREFITLNHNVMQLLLHYILFRAVLNIAEGLRGHC